MTKKWDSCDSNSVKQMISCTMTNYAFEHIQGGTYRSEDGKLGFLVTLDYTVELINTTEPVLPWKTLRSRLEMFELRQRATRNCSVKGCALLVLSKLTFRASIWQN